MPGTERDLVSRLLKQSILALCREAVSYNSRLEIDGIVCVTLDNHTDHVVKIHELFSKTELPTCTSSDNPSSSRDSEDSSFQPSVPTTINIPVKVEIKSEPNSPLIVEKEIKRESVSPVITDEETKRESPAPVSDDVASRNSPATKPSSRQASPVLTSDTSTPIKLQSSQARNITCKKCNAMLDDATAFENHNMTSHGYFTCMVCLATFTSRNNMKRHLRLHTGIKPYTCGTCKESFARNDDYKRHLLRHSFDKPFRCVLCKSGYSDRSCIKNHMLKEHHSKQFHICPHCGLSFNDVQQFQLHKKIHPEFQGYRCSLCSFTGSSCLMYNKHMLTHGSPKRYICAHCEVPFNDPFTYTSHMKQHKGDELVQTYRCCFCDHVAPSFEQFQRHEHSHVQSKQHTCKICDKQFRYPSNLREHMLTHMDKSALPGLEPVKAASAIEIAHDTSNHDTSDSTMQRNNEQHDYEQMDDDIMPPLVDSVDASIGSDYWCTECNQGFGTEDQLQEHIINTHENVRDSTASPDGSLKSNESGISLMDKREESEAKLYRLNTQLDSPSDSRYDEDTQLSTMSSPSIPRKAAYDDDTRLHGASIYEDHTQSRTSLLSTSNKRKSSNPPTRKVSPRQQVNRNAMFKRARIFDEETIIDEKDTYKEDLDKEITAGRPNAAMDFNSTEMAIVEDAMRQVQQIQSRFGIKSTMLGNGNKKKAKGDPNIGEILQNPASRMMKSMGRDRQRNITLHDINKNTIPSSTVSSTISADTNATSSSESATPNREKMITLESSHDKNEGIQDNPSSSSLFQHYSKTSVLGMDTEFSTTPNRGSPTTLNLTLKSPGFEKVITPMVLFKTRSPFTCELCEESFTEFDSFDRHGISIHRRYICSYCGKPFTSRPNRERHVRYHTGEKPYKCDVCHVSFFRGDDLKYHRTTKHSDIRPFLCGTCNKSFTLPKELERHLRVYPDHRGNEIIVDV